MEPNSDDKLLRDDILAANSDKYGEIKSGGPLFLDITFYKKFDTIRDPDTGKLVDLDVISCFEFPQFVCLVEQDFTISDDSWRIDILDQFVNYLKIKSAAFAKMFVSSEPIWINDVTVRFSVT
jgi:hypothetical protein